MEANETEASSLGAARPPTAGPFDVQAIRAQFPVFAERTGTIFFDNASTTQKPGSVIDTITTFYRRDCANAGRSSYEMSTALASRIELARARVASFIGAGVEDVAFTSGCTESLNAVALGWGLHNLRAGDEVMVCYEDHKSTVLPWLNLQHLLSTFGKEIKIVPICIHPEGDYELRSIKGGTSGRTRLVAMTHVHHVYGLDMEVEAVRKIVGADVLISLDASQTIGHRPLNVADLNVDFLSFSGHKMFAGNGVGVLYAAPRARVQMRPILVGGGMGVIIDGADLAAPAGSLRDLLEPGTQNIPSILSLVPAIDFLEGIGLETIDSRVDQLTRYLYERLKRLAGIEFSPGIDRCGCQHGFGIVSFRFEAVTTSDIAFLLDSEGILVRTGDHCLSRRQDGDDYVRISLHAYNTEEEIDRLTAVLGEALPGA